MLFVKVCLSEKNINAINHSHKKKRWINVAMLCDVLGQPEYVFQNLLTQVCIARVNFYHRLTQVRIELENKSETEIKIRKKSCWVRKKLFW